MASSIKTSTTRTSEGPSSSVKTTTYETTSRSSYETDLSGPTYRSQLTPRTTIIQRTSYGGPGGRGSTAMERKSQYGAVMSMGAPAGAYANVTNVGVNSVKVSRDREKKDMQDLNERFASYIEKVRFLEAQNRKLAEELDRLKQKWGKETSAIKAMYQAELDEARKLLDDAEKEKARLEIRCASLEEQIEEMRTKLDEANHSLAIERERVEKQNQQLSDYEAEINLLRRRIEMLENDRDKDKKEIARLSDALNRARIDLDNETLAHIDAENRRQTLEEELEFLKAVHEQEMKELAALAYRDTTSENREFWKSELSNAIREIQVTYDEKLDQMRGEMETYYNMKIQEFRTGATRQNMETVHAKEESKRLRQQITDLRAKLGDLEARNSMLERELASIKREYEEKEREWEEENSELKSEVAKLRAEMEAMLKELQDLMDTKLGLELEIAAYRKLLEGEENRFGLKGIVETMMTSSSVNQAMSQQMMESAGSGHARAEDDLHVVKSYQTTTSSSYSSGGGSGGGAGGAGGVGVGGGSGSGSLSGGGGGGGGTGYSYQSSSSSMGGGGGGGGGGASFTSGGGGGGASASFSSSSGGGGGGQTQMQYSQQQQSQQHML